MDATRNLEEQVEKVVHRRLVLDVVQNVEHLQRTCDCSAELTLWGKRARKDGS